MGPPATPAPSRFLLSKKPSTQSLQDVDGSASQKPPGPQQFRATPRFSVSSTPRPSSGTQTFSTPLAPSFSVRSSRARSTQEIIDDSSPASPKDASLSPESPESPANRRWPEPIELDSSFISPSPSSELAVERPPKRRRISISPDLSVSPGVKSSQPRSADDHGVISLDGTEDSDTADRQDEDDLSELEQDSQFHGDELLVAQEQQEDDPITTQADLHSDYDAHIEYETQSDVDVTDADTANAQAHPTFRKAPRFKASEFAADGPQEQYLPDAFSPQRRGVKYASGGLAAELRDWLVSVKGSDPDQQGLSTAVGLEVISVRHGGTGMSIVEGRRVSSVDGSTDDFRIRALLAGEGRVSGLGKPNALAPGSVVMVSPPVWDIQLGSETWAVACDWAVD